MRLKQMYMRLSGLGTVASTPLQEALLYGAGLPIYDVGDFTYKDVAVSKRSNGYSWRWAVPNNTALPLTLTNDGTRADSATGLQILGEFLVPGGLAVHNDQIDLSITVSCSGAFAGDNLEITLDTNGYGPLLYDGHLWRIPDDGRNPQTFSCTFSFNESNTISPAATTGSMLMVGTQDGLPVNANIASDWKIRVGVNINASRGRTYTLNSASFCKVRQNHAPIPSDLTLYRKPTTSFFNDKSFIYVPLPATVAVADKSEATTQALTLGANYGGSNAGIPVSNDWMGGMNISHLDGSIQHFQMLDSDPWTKVSYRGCGEGTAFLFPNATPQGSGTFTARLPKSNLPFGQVPDYICFLITPDKRYAIEAGGYRGYDSAADTHVFGDMRVTDLYGTGTSNVTTNLYNTTYIESNYHAYAQRSYRASGISVAGGIVTMEDWQSGSIEHMVHMLVDTTTLRTSMVRVDKTGTAGKRFRVRSATRIDGGTDVFQRFDYSSMFTAGAVIYWGGIGYVSTGNESYAIDSRNIGYTSFDVSTVITPHTAEFAFVGGPEDSVGINGSLYSVQNAWPASSHDGGANYYDPVTGLHDGNSYKGVIPMGAVFTIPKSVNVDALPVNDFLKFVAKGIQKYGAYVGDSTNITFSLVQVDGALSNFGEANGLSPNQYQIGLVRQQLRRVTNYNRSTVLAAQQDASLSRGRPLLPMY